MTVRELKAGTIVRALRRLDPGAADVHEGDVGVVFGAANCYGDNCGPIVRWLRIEPGEKRNMIVMGGTCNIYSGQVDVLLRPDTGFLNRIAPSYFARILALTIYKEFEADNWGDIDPEWFSKVFDLDSEADMDLVRDVKALEAVMLRVVHKLRETVVREECKHNSACTQLSPKHGDRGPVPIRWCGLCGALGIFNPLVKGKIEWLLPGVRAFTQLRLFSEDRGDRLCGWLDHESAGQQEVRPTSTISDEDHAFGFLRERAPISPAAWEKLFQGTDLKNEARAWLQRWIDEGLCTLDDRLRVVVVEGS